MKRTMIAAALLVLAAGCSGSTGGHYVAPKAAAPTSSPAPADEPSPTPSDSGVVAFGGGFQWSDGLVVQVGRPRPYHATQYAAGGEHAAAKLAFAITIANGSKTPWDPALFHATVQSGSSEGDRIFDTTLPEDPSTKLLPGRKVSFTVAYGVDSPSDVVMEVTPDFTHDAVVFSSSGH